MNTMKIILGTSISPVGSTEILLPKGSQVLRIGFEVGRILLWVLHDVGAPYKRRRFHVVDTGVPFPAGGPCVYVGTIWGRNGLHHVLEFDPPVACENKAVALYDNGPDGGLTVGELRSKLQGLPDGLLVLLETGEFGRFDSAENIGLRNVVFSVGLFLRFLDADMYPGGGGRFEALVISSRE